MGIMDKMRAGTDSFLIQVVFVIIIVSFIFWGVGGQGPKTQTVANVNGERITDTEYQRVLFRVLRSQEQALSDDQEAMLRGQVLDSLIEKEVMLQEARRLGLAISPEEIKRDIFKTEAFYDAEGKFSVEIYERLLSRSGVTRAAYETEVHDRLLLDRLRNLAVGAVRLSDAELREAFIAENTLVGLELVTIGDLAVLGEVEVPPAEVDALVAADPDRVRAAYDAQFERRFNKPARATISTILLRTDIDGADPAVVRARLEAVAAELSPGEAFEQAARTWSEDLSAVSGGNLGSLSAEQLDPALAEVVFATEAGALTPIVETSRGLQVLWVRERTEAVVTPFEEAAPTLARELLQEERAPALADEVAEAVLAAWKAEGATPAALLDSHGLTVQPMPDFNLASPTLGPMGPAPALMADLADAKAGEVLPSVYRVGGQRVIARVGSRQDADLTAFEDDADLLRQRMLYTRQLQFVQDWRDALIAEADVERFL